MFETASPPCEPISRRIVGVTLGNARQPLRAQPLPAGGQLGAAGGSGATTVARSGHGEKAAVLSEKYLTRSWFSRVCISRTAYGDWFCTGVIEIELSRREVDHPLTLCDDHPVRFGVVLWGFAPDGAENTPYASETIIYMRFNDGTNWRCTYPSADRRQSAQPLSKSRRGMGSRVQAPGLGVAVLGRTVAACGGSVPVPGRAVARRAVGIGVLGCRHRKSGSPPAVRICGAEPR